MGKNDKVVTEKKKSKVKFESFQNGTARISRPSLPLLLDRTDKALSWLKDQGFKSEEIEIIGEKPTNWDTIFNPIVDSVVDPADVTTRVEEIPA